MMVLAWIIVLVGVAGVFVLGAMFGGVVGACMSCAAGIVLISVVETAGDKRYTKKHDKAVTAAQGFPTKLAQEYVGELRKQKIYDLNSEENRAAALALVRSNGKYNIPNAEQLYPKMYAVGSGQESEAQIPKRKGGKAVEPTLCDKYNSLGEVRGKRIERVIEVLGKPTTDEPIGSYGYTMKTWISGKCTVKLTFDQFGSCNDEMPICKGPSTVKPWKRPFNLAGVVAMALVLVLGYAVINNVAGIDWFAGGHGAICIASGCSEEQAGPYTAYCVKHSGHCLNCGKYVDPDATYCMKCITGR